MDEDVKQRLLSFGYTTIESDAWMLKFIIQKVQNHINNECNVTSIPEGLHEIALDMICGEFLLEKKNMGLLTNFDLDTAVKSIQEGDTNITFAIGSGSMTPEQRLNALIDYLISCGKTEFASYRCIKW